MVSCKLLAYVLNRYVTRKNEREFMGLEPREEPAEPSRNQEFFEQGEVKAGLEEDEQGE